MQTVSAYGAREFASALPLLWGVQGGARVPSRHKSHKCRLPWPGVPRCGTGPRRRGRRGAHPHGPVQPSCECAETRRNSSPAAGVPLDSQRLQPVSRGSQSMTEASIRAARSAVLQRTAPPQPGRPADQCHTYHKAWQPVESGQAEREAVALVPCRQQCFEVKSHSQRPGAALAAVCSACVAAPTLQHRHACGKSACQALKKGRPAALALVALRKVCGSESQVTPAVCVRAL